MDFSNNKDFVNSPEYNLWAETVPVRTRHGQTLVINIPSFGGVFSCATASTEQVNEENCGPQLAYIRVNCITSRAGNAGQQLLSVCTDPMEFIYLPVFKEHQETVSKIRKKSLRNNDSFNRVMNEVSGDCNESAPCADDIKGRLVSYPYLPEACLVSRTNDPLRMVLFLPLGYLSERSTLRFPLGNLRESHLHLS